MTYPGKYLFPGPDTYPAAPVVKMGAPPGFDDGQVVTAADFNTIALLVEYLAQITTGRGTGVSTTTGKLSTGRPAVKCFLSNPFTVYGGLVTSPIMWDTAVIDSENQFHLPNPYVLHVQVDGWYRVELQAAFGKAGPGQRTANILVNGFTDANIVAGSNMVIGRPNDVRLQVVAYLQLTAGAQIAASVQQNATGTPTTISATTNPNDTTITVAGSIPVGSLVAVDRQYTTAETVLVTAVSGSGPYTLTVTGDLTGATSVGMKNYHLAGYEAAPVLQLLPQNQRGTWLAMRWIAPHGQ